MFAFSACTEEVEYTPASAETAEGVYFPSTLASKIDLSSDANSFNVQLSRSSKVGEQEVALNVVTNDTVGFFTFPDTVVFEDGKTTAEITIGYQFDPENPPYDEYFDVEISVNENEASAYGSKTYVFTAGIPGPWESLGLGKYFDYMFMDDGEYVEVEVQQNKITPSQFRLVKPYHELFGGPFENTAEYLVFSILEQNSTLGDVLITQQDLVYFEPYNTGYVNGDNGEVWLYHPVHFTSKGNDEANFVYSKVLGYQENNLPNQVQLAPMYFMPAAGGGYDYTQKDNTVIITFPGAVLTDYSVGVEYLGKFIDANDNVFADLGVAMGADAATVKVGLDMSEDINGILSGVLDGSINPVELTAAGTTRFAMKTPGVYTAVAVSYDADGNPREAAYTQFEYSAAGGPVWNSLGIAQYTEGFIVGLGVPTVTYNVEIQESEETPGLYRLVNPYGAAFPYNEDGDWDASKDYYLEINAQDAGGVYIQSQALGFDWGYGMFYASSMAGFYIEQGATLDEVKSMGICGTLADGVITFPSQTLLVAAEGLTGESWGYANIEKDENNQVIEGAAPFKVVLPSATKSSKSVKAVNSTKAVNKKLVAAKKLRKMDKQLPKKVQLKK